MQKDLSEMEKLVRYPQVSTWYAGTICKHIKKIAASYQKILCGVYPTKTIQLAACSKFM